MASPSPHQSLPGSSEIRRAGDKHRNVTPPPGASPSGSIDIQQPEIQAIGSTPPPEPSLSVPDDLTSTELHSIQTATTFDSRLEHILQLPFEDRLIKVSINDLTYRVPEERDSPLVLNFATLYRMRLHALRSQMVKQMFEIRYHNALAPGWEATLKEYGKCKRSRVSLRLALELTCAQVQAWRDWDYVNECAKRKNDPFLLKSSSCLDAALLREHLACIRSSLTSADAPLLRQYEMDSTFPGPKDIKEPEVLGGLRNRVNKETQFRAFNVRLAMAGLGWAFIVGPMLLMVLSDTKVTALCTSSVCVFAFGFLMARTLEKPFDVTSATAVYVAVLVVFVGSNIAPGV